MDYNYLFVKGDQNPRGSVKAIGQFYKIDAILALIGIVALILKKKYKPLFLILLWLFLAPIPAAFSSMDTNATRSIFLIGPVIILSAYGAGSLVERFKSKWVKIVIASVILVSLSFEFKNYITYYFSVYGKENAIEWQYGMEQTINYLVENPNFQKVYVDNVRQQPYIFYLYYMKYPLPNLLKTVKYDQSQDKSFNTVRSFDRYQFGGWNIIESYPGRGIIYVVTPSYHTGLRRINDFEVKKLIKYPDGTDAFYVVEGNSE